MIKILCVGKIKEKYLNDLINDYKLRLSKYQKVEIIEIKDTNIKEESEEIMKRLSDKDYNICMDIGGVKLTSVGLSELINDTFVNGKCNITFIIGGSCGIEEYVKKKCDKRLSFSDMTFPHGLFRGILLEQIYRSFKILNNESYHK